MEVGVKGEGPLYPQKAHDGEAHAIYETQSPTTELLEHFDTLLVVAVRNPVDMKALAVTQKPQSHLQAKAMLEERGGLGQDVAVEQELLVVLEQPTNQRNSSGMVWVRSVRQGVDRRRVE